MLARLGRAPHYLLFRAISNGTGFLFDNDYVKYVDVEVKRETPGAESMPSGAIKDPMLSIGPSPSSSAALSAARTRKRLHRSAAATVKSYALPDSDDDNPTHAISEVSWRRIGTSIVESNLQLWIKHLTALHKDETKKFNEKKRRLEQSNISGARIRAVRSDFLRTLTTSLRELRQLDSAKKQQTQVSAVPDEYSESDDDEYQCRRRPSRRRKTS
ncbi:hypothetical protein BGW80DRAFT_484625 [Lactifluus volemus]|nr:hypothetical protein BGW80DRAFT_484625 [Lactifluus volemus]